MVGFGFGKEAKSVTIETKLYFSDADSAEDAVDIINGVIALLKGLISVPEAKDLLDMIDGGAE